MIINILDYLENSAKKFPDKTVFAEQNKSISYSLLVDKAKRIGTKILDETGNLKRKPIIVFVDRNIESLVVFIGVAYSGNFYVPIDRSMPKMRIDLILKTLQPVATIILESEVDFAKEIAPDVRTLIYEEASAYPIDEPRLAAIRKQAIDTDPLYATFTSGSTGIPKGVITCQRSVIDMTEALFTTFNFDEHCIFGNQNPFYFDASIKDIYSTLKGGGTMVIIPRSCFTFTGSLAPFLMQNSVNTILWSAAAIALVANTSAYEFEKPYCLEKVMFSGEVMHNKALNYWRKNLPETLFVNLYGPTEITSVCSYYIVNRPFGDDEVLPIGESFKNTDIIILNESNELVKEDESGELCVRGCCLAMGYYNNPEKTREAFIQNPLNTSFPEIIYRTGDLAKYNQQGQIIFLSRKDNQVKHMGQRVELGEIEIVANSMEYLDASVCFYDHEKQKIVLVYQGINADKKYILNGVKDKLPKYMFPNILIEMKEMPYNLNGKIDRTLIKTLYRQGEIS
ncbi:MAG: AMP-binding protein [Prolixibacteraceae bacterium]|jgi:amino acid adenylation domain-containing protein|nr:AMP-binding protein [Prolixibacteraceae bacterium]